MKAPAPFDFNLRGAKVVLALDIAEVEQDRKP